MSDFFALLPEAHQLVPQVLKLVGSEVLDRFDGLLPVCLLSAQVPLKVSVFLLTQVETALQVPQGRIFIPQQVSQVGGVGGQFGMPRLQVLFF